MGSGLTAALAMTLGLALAGGASAAGGDSPSYHIFPTAKTRGAAPKAATEATAAARMLYYGGPVISKAKVVSVIWGANVNQTTVKQIGPFYRTIVDSTFIDQLAQYHTNLKGTNGHAGTNQTIGRGTYVGQVQISPANKALSLTDGQIQTELRNQIATHHLPANDGNTLYMVYFPAVVSISSYGQSCVAFSAYHSSSSATVSAKNIYYGVFPDCGGTFSETTTVSSHELAEAISDAIPTPGSHPAYPQAWNTFDGYEIADLCETLAPSRLTKGLVNYAVTKVYLNGLKRCSTANYTGS